MLRISRLADYGMLMMDCLNRQYCAPMSAANLAAEIQVGSPTVSKVLKLLLEAGLLTSSQGVNGGYQLSRSAGDITVADIIKAIDGVPALTECGQGDEQCSRESSCQLKGNWRYINKMVYGVLDKISLAAMQSDLSEQPIRFYPRESV